MNRALPTRPPTIAIQAHSNGDTDTITWSNWDMPKDWGLYVGLTIWTVICIPIALGLTFGTAYGALPVIVSVIFLPIFWGGLLMVLAVYPRLGARESITMTDAYLEVRVAGVLLNRAVKYPRDAVRGLSLERYGEETALTLNLWSQGVHWLTSRTLLAYTVHPAAKAEIYQILSAFFERRGWVVNCRQEPLKAES